MNFDTFSKEVYKQLQPLLRKHTPIGIKTDRFAKPNISKQKAEKFCIFFRAPKTLWNRDFCSFHLIDNPFRELDEKHESNLRSQVRFQFNIVRKETGSGKYNQEVLKVLKQAKANLPTFDLIQSDRIYNLHFSTSTPPSPETISSTANHLADLINQVAPGINKIDKS